MLSFKSINSLNNYSLKFKHQTMTNHSYKYEPLSFIRFINISHEY